MHCTVGKKTPHSNEESKAEHKVEKETVRRIDRQLGFLSHGKLSIRINTICMLEAKAGVEGRL